MGHVRLPVQHVGLPCGMGFLVKMTVLPIETYPSQPFFGRTRCWSFQTIPGDDRWIRWHFGLDVVVAFLYLQMKQWTSIYNSSQIVWFRLPLLGCLRCVAEAARSAASIATEWNLLSRLSQSPPVTACPAPPWPSKCLQFHQLCHRPRRGWRHDVLHLTNESAVASWRNCRAAWNLRNRLSHLVSQNQDPSHRLQPQEWK